MDRITRVTLFGFKGLDREYDLDGPTVLSGENGSGKSACLEAIVYALSGRVPAGKKLDAIAAYFPPRGGSVEVHDAAGRWIRRGIVRDHGKAKVSEVLTTSDTKEAEKPNLDAWQASDVVLDVREFLALSPEKRREFVLKLCGGGEVPVDLAESLQVEYARAIAGPGATATTLSRGLDLPEAVRTLAVAWTRPRGLAEVFAAQLGAAAGGKSLSEVFVRLAEVAAEGKLGSRRSAVEASAAIRELEAEAQGARAAAAAIDSRRRAVEALREEMSSLRARTARRDEARKRLEAAREARVRAEQARRDADSPNVPPPPGERPAAPAADRRREEFLSRIQAADADLREAQGVEREAQALIDALKAAKLAYGEAERAFAAANRLPIARVVLLLEEIPDEADPMIPDLRAAVEDLAAGWRAETAGLERRAEAADQKLQATREAAAFAGSSGLAASGRADGKMTTLSSLRRDLAQVDAENAGGDAAYRKALAAWEAADRAHRAAETSRAAADRDIESAARAETEAQKRLHAVEQVNSEAFPQLEDLEARLYTAQGELETAEKALGAVQAYQSATARAEQARVDEEAWKKAETALRVLRERVVGGSVVGLAAEINGVLETAGRKEVVYLDLENERGKPAFDLGWIRGEAKTSIAALSAGEAVLFLAALSVALTRRSAGRRVLLVEADPLDTGNLEGLLAALLPQAKELEALLVATAAEGWEAPEGWRVVELGREVRA